MRSLKHDHGACIQTALSRAEQRCAEAGERFTGLRRQVLELVWAEHKPAKAYDLLKKLSDLRSGVAPTTVYRTLDFLQELVHKIESLNAYVGCSQPNTEHSGHFLICEACSEIKEIENSKISAWLESAAQDENSKSKLKLSSSLACVFAASLHKGTSYHSVIDDCPTSSCKTVRKRGSLSSTDLSCHLFIIRYSCGQGFSSIAILYGS